MSNLPDNLNALREAVDRVNDGCQDYMASNAKLLTLLREIRSSGVEHDDPRLGYITVQMDRELIQAIDEILEEKP